MKCVLLKEFLLSEKWDFFLKVVHTSEIRVKEDRVNPGVCTKNAFFSRKDFPKKLPASDYA